jgi:kinesin family protein 5
MKVENMIKLKEEFDYKSLSRRLDIELDKLIMEHERQQKAFEDEIERLAIEAQHRISEAERNYADSLEVGSISIFYINVICVVVCVNDFL